MNTFYANQEIARQHYAALQSEAALHRIAQEGAVPDLPNTAASDRLHRVLRAVMPHRRSLRPAVRSV